MGAGSVRLRRLAVGGRLMSVARASCCESLACFRALLASRWAAGCLRGRFPVVAPPFPLERPIEWRSAEFDGHGDGLAAADA